MFRQFFLKVTLGLLSSCMVFASTVPEGVWISVDKKTGEKQADIELRLVNDELRGTIIRPYTKPGGLTHCLSCSGHFKNKPIQGIEFIWGLHADDHGGWDGGRLLDPRTGHIYRVKVVQHGDELHVRGYLGVSWLGQTEVWLRADV